MATTTITTREGCHCTTTCAAHAQVGRKGEGGKATKQDRYLLWQAVEEEVEVCCLFCLVVAESGELAIHPSSRQDRQRDGQSTPTSGRATQLNSVAICPVK